MKKILIVAATHEELAPAFKHFSWPHNPFIKHENFNVLITGVGIAATAFALGKYLNEDYDIVLNVGIAGSFDRSVPLGSLVNVVTDTFSELGTDNGEEFIPIDELGFGKSSYSSNFNLPNPIINDLPLVNGITVNRVHGHTKRIISTLERLPVKTESMEGAAVFYACEQMNIQALQVRCISNYIEQRNKDNWEIELAIKNLNKWLIHFLNANFTL